MQRLPTIWRFCDQVNGSGRSGVPLWRGICTQNQKVWLLFMSHLCVHSFILQKWWHYVAVRLCTGTEHEGHHRLPVGTQTLRGKRACQFKRQPTVVCRVRSAGLRGLVLKMELWSFPGVIM